MSTKSIGQTFRTQDVTKTSRGCPTTMMQFRVFQEIMEINFFFNPSSFRAFSHGLTFH